VKGAKTKERAVGVPEAAPSVPTASPGQHAKVDLPPRQHSKVDLVLEPEFFLEEMARVSLQEVAVGGRVLRPGSRVRLHPRADGDLLDTALAGRSAVIEGIDEDDTGAAHVAVIVDDDPGRGLGSTRHPAHRFFFAPWELEPLEQDEGSAPQRRVLVAGIGNLFLGDDGFGAVVAQRLLERKQTAGVEVVDFGIRGMDLAYALGQFYHAAILVDALPGGGVPGVLVVMEAQTEGEAAPNLDGHRMDPLSVLRVARSLGPLPGQILIVGCRPQEISEEWHPETAMSLSAPVAAAVEKAADLVEQLAAQLAAAPCQQNSPQ
jgi:hydrogenase maturation protease